MQYTQSMNLHSPSGYAMPFELSENSPLEISLNYGKQVNPYTGNEFFHHGVDFKVRPGTWLKALATGIVSGIASDMQKGFYITVTYKNYADGDQSSYQVIYSHIKESLCTFGKNVSAGDNVAVCDENLHIEVTFNGEEVNPMEFLTMMRDNLMMQSQSEMSGKNPEIATMDFDVHTPYDAHKAEIEAMQQKYAASYFWDMLRGKYKVPQDTETHIRDLLTEGANRGIYYEHTPSMMNPLGLGTLSFPFLNILHTAFITDFLNYMALQHGIFLSHMSESDKKKLMTKQ